MSGIVIPHSDLPFGMAVVRWRVNAEIGRRKRTVESHEELVRALLRHWPEPDAKTVADVTEDDVREFAKRVEHYSAARWNAFVMILRAVVPHVAGIMRRKTVRPKIVVLPDAEKFQAVLRELDNAHRGHAGLIVRLLACTGLRISEARALRWVDVLPEGILVRDSKTHAARLVPFVGECRSVLASLQKITGKQEGILPHASVKKALAGACRRAGVAHLTHHDFRRLFATRCLESSVDLPTAARWLGHKDGGALLGKTYFHLLSDHQRAMAARVRI